ncbi:MAG: HEAT repeat domain-containing protein [Deltaproteobacteria bacterium]|nr:HEAT repeat domain-containing protein [Deltaproteobacteria bacterium]
MPLNLEKIRKELEGPSDDARYDAWLALYTSEEKEAVGELQKIVQSKDPILKVLFLRFLGHIDQERAVVYIVQLLQDKNSVVVDAAKKSFDRNLFNAKLKKLIPLIHSSQKPEKYFAIEKLSQGGEISILDDLLKMMTAGDEDLLIQILTALRFLADKKVIPHILPFLKDDRETVRLKVVLVLGAIFEFGYFPVKKRLLAALTDPSPDVRRTVLWSIRRHPAKEDIPLLLHISFKDSDPTVRQEGLIELGSFPIPKVIRHLLQLMVFETDRSLVLKAEGVLLSYPVDLLVRGLGDLLHSGDPRLRNKAMLLFAQFEKNSKPYLRYLLKGLQAAENEKEKIPFIEALGMIEAKEGAPLLEKETHGSYLVAYAAMVSLTKIWRVLPDPPIFQYLEDAKLHPLLRQMVLKYLVRKGSPAVFSEVMVALLTGFLKDANTNVRYLSAQALVLSGRESVVHALFEMILKETDPTSLKFLEENILRLLVQNTSLFPALIGENLQNKHAVEILFDMMGEGEMPSKQLLAVIPAVLKAPLRLMQTEYGDLCADFVYSAVVSRQVTLESVLETITDCPDQNRLLSGLAKRFGKNRSFRFYLSAAIVKKLFQTKDPLQTGAVIELLGQTEGEAAVEPLVAVVCDDSLASLHPQAAASLNRLLGMKL